MIKMTISTIAWDAQHPKAGRNNIQQVFAHYLKNGKALHKMNERLFLGFLNCHSLFNTSEQDKFTPFMNDVNLLYIIIILLFV